MMYTRASTTDLLALRDGEPIDVEVERMLRDDPDTPRRLAALLEIRSALRALPPAPPPAPGLWARVEARVDERARLRSGRFSRFWPAGVAASVFLIAGMLLTGFPDDPALDTTRNNIVVLKQQSRQLEAVLMRASSYTGSSSEQALMFGLADVDRQLAALAAGGSLADLQLRDRLWQRRIELMQALHVVQPPAQPSVQYAVY